MWRWRVRGMRVRTAIRFAAVAAAALASASPASGAVTFGSNLSAAPNSNSGCGMGCTVIADKLIAANQAPAGFAAPIDGVIVRWRVRSGAAPTAAALRVVRRPTMTTGLGAGTSATELPIANATSTFGTRLPVKAGDRIGLDTVKAFGVGGGGLNALIFSPALGDGETRAPFASVNSDLTLNADLEPDLDGDGYGDETQDSCATDSTVQGPCPDRAAPQTTITKRPKRRTSRRRVRLAFASDEPGSSFECRVAKKPFRPCSSPARVKLKRGRNLIEVRAVDAAGNVDPSPARAKVRRRR